jgi:hypothetical protein
VTKKDTFLARACHIVGAVGIGGVLVLAGCAPMVDAVVRLHGIEIDRPCAASNTHYCVATTTKERP